MDAGKKNRRVLLQVLAAGQDGAGQPSTTWENVIATGDGKIWAAVVDISGREFVAAGGAQNAVTTKITIGYRAGRTPAMRVTHGTDIYNIEAILGQGRADRQLMCSRGGSNG